MNQDKSSNVILIILIIVLGYFIIKFETGYSSAPQENEEPTPETDIQYSDYRNQYNYNDNYDELYNYVKNNKSNTSAEDNTKPVEDTPQVSDNINTTTVEENNQPVDDNTNKNDDNSSQVDDTLTDIERIREKTKITEAKSRKRNL